MTPGVRLSAAEGAPGRGARLQAGSRTSGGAPRQHAGSSLVLRTGPGDTGQACEVLATGRRAGGGRCASPARAGPSRATELCCSLALPADGVPRSPGGSALAGACGEAGSSTPALAWEVTGRGRPR